MFSWIDLALSVVSLLLVLAQAAVAVLAISQAIAI